MKHSNRRSAKMVVEDMTNEILARPPSEDKESKLALIHSLAIRMSWNQLADKIKFTRRDSSTPKKEDWYSKWSRENET